MPLEPRQDPQTVTPSGERVAPLIDGVKLRYAVTQVDERGTICEILNPAWGFHDAPIVYVYELTVAPYRVKGWVVHYEQEDRLFLRHGRVKIVLYDDRPQSKTYKMVNVICLSDQNRALLAFPTHIYHAIQNIGENEAVLINMPTRPYKHAKPDKYRLPLNNDKIPYRFDAQSLGG
jgi:dTDP-4-dehydrorhamnose 3,5-epimerase